MIDLFGDEITVDQQESEYGFAEFWAAYPSGTRKVAKAQCLQKWKKLGCAQEAAHIIQHVGFMRRQDDWTKQGGAFVCAPMVYLNQQRWIDWQPEPERKREPDALQTILAHKGAPMPESVKSRLVALRREMRA